MIGIVGSGPEAAAASDAVEGAGERAWSGSAAAVIDADPDVVVALGKRDLHELLRASEDPPPVMILNSALTGRPTGDLAEAVERLAAGDFETRGTPTIRARTGDAVLGRGAFDVMVVTSDPGNISEYRIVSGSELGTIRADGVVVATPAGSRGYARAAGGPVIQPGSEAMAVVPVGAFTMEPAQWVVGLGTPVELANERAVPNSLLLDGAVHDLNEEQTVAVDRGERFDLVVLEDER